MYKVTIKYCLSKQIRTFQVTGKSSRSYFMFYVNTSMRFCCLLPNQKKEICEFIWIVIFTTSHARTIVINHVEFLEL